MIRDKVSSDIDQLKHGSIFMRSVGDSVYHHGIPEDTFLGL